MVVRDDFWRTRNDIIITSFEVCFWQLQSNSWEEWRGTAGQPVSVLKTEIGTSRISNFCTNYCCCFMLFIPSFIHSLYQPMNAHCLTGHDILYMLCPHEIPLGWYNSRQMSVYILRINVDTCKLVLEEGHSHIVLIF